MKDDKLAKVVKYSAALAAFALYYFLIRVASGIVLADGVGSDDALRGCIAIGFLALVAICVTIYVFID